MTTDNDEVDQDILVKEDKLKLLYAQSSFSAVLLSLAVAMLLVIILWPVQSHDLLVGWYMMLVIASLARVIMHSKFREAKPSAGNILQWEGPYLLTLTFSVLVWGLGAVVIMPADSPHYQIGVFCFILGLSGGAISVYSAHRLMVLITVITILLPSTIWMFAQKTHLTIGVGIAALMYLASLIRASKIYSLSLEQNLTLAHQLKYARDQAEILARRDALTDLFNRRAFREHVDMAISESKRHKLELSLILIDLDYFKRINDSLGHAAGDAALIHIGLLLRNYTRLSDVCARIGGEEFAILLKGATLQDAKFVAEKLRSEIQAHPAHFSDQDISLTASFGVASGDVSFESLLAKADSALYVAKNTGRNRVCVSD